MGEWRYYAQRATTGEWLNTDVEFDNPVQVWSLSAPQSGAFSISNDNGGNYIADDGRPVWGRRDTILLAEEDGKLAWGGICTNVKPEDSRTVLEFAGFTYWWQGVPFNDVYRTWERDVFDVVRTLVAHTRKYNNFIDIQVSRGDSGLTVGDPQPPNRPREPGRRKGQSKKQYQDSNAYKRWNRNAQAWDKKYGKRERFEIAWWESPFVGEEIDSLANDFGFEYEERLEWVDRSELTYRINVDLALSFRQIRDDLAFVETENIALPVEPKDDVEPPATRVIALGAGEGRDMVRVEVGQNDGRLFRAEFVAYKEVKNPKQLRRRAQADYERLSNMAPPIDTIAAWDLEGYASLSTLRCGDIVSVRTFSTIPEINDTYRVTQISRDPNTNVVVVTVEAS